FTRAEPHLVRGLVGPPVDVDGTGREGVCARCHRGAVARPPLPDRLPRYARITRVPQASESGGSVGTRAVGGERDVVDAARDAYVGVDDAAERRGGTDRLPERVSDVRRHPAASASASATATAATATAGRDGRNLAGLGRRGLAERPREALCGP